MTTERSAAEGRRRVDLCRILFASGYVIVARRRSGIRLWMVERRRKLRGGAHRSAADWLAIAAARAKRWRASLFNGSAKPLDKTLFSTVQKESREGTSES